MNITEKMIKEIPTIIQSMCIFTQMFLYKMTEKNGFESFIIFFFGEMQFSQKFQSFRLLDILSPLSFMQN